MTSAGSAPRPRSGPPPHVLRSVVLSVCVLLTLGILVGGAIGLLAVKVFDLMPLDHLTGNIGPSQQAPSQTHGR